MTVAIDRNAASPLPTMENNMETRPRATRNRTLATRVRASLVCFSFAAMMSCPVSGYTIPVVEVGLNTWNSTLTEINTLASQGEALAEYGEQYDRFVKTAANWQQKLAKFNQIIASPLMPKGVTLKPVPIEWNVAERCGAGSIMSLSGILTALDMSPGGDIMAQQRNICAAIQVLENQKYNETVEVVQKTMPDMRKVLDRIKDIRDLWKGEGSMAETSANAVVSDAYMQAEFTTWEKQTQGYDKQIQALTKMQQILAQRALKGTGQSPLGTVVKAAALKAALSN